MALVNFIYFPPWMCIGSTTVQRGDASHVPERGRNWPWVVSGCWLTLPKWPFNNLLLLGSPNNCGGVVWPGICKINSASSPSVLSLFLWFLICSTKSFASTRKLSSIFFISWAVRVFGGGGASFCWSWIWGELVEFLTSKNLSGNLDPKRKRTSNEGSM